MNDNHQHSTTEAAPKENAHTNHNEQKEGNHSNHSDSSKNNDSNGHSAKHSDLIDYTSAKSAAMTLRAINHKLRQQIVSLLDENKRMNVTDIYVKLRLEQSVASQHLAILRRADIVKTVREGKFIHYALNYDRIAEVSNFIKELNGTEKAA
jgi:DNA-binding transcriptional ArsR family regulator